jgi:acyl-CoA synthetase (AMP-forming)/AMP-acid ligase II
VYSKLRDVMGGQLTYLGSGGAAASPKVLQFFEDIGIPVLEGYGLTETSPVISAGTEIVHPRCKWRVLQQTDNSVVCVAAGGLDWKDRRLGCAGVPLYNVICKIFNPETGVSSVTYGSCSCAVVMLLFLLMSRDLTYFLTLCDVM